MQHAFIVDGSLQRAAAAAMVVVGAAVTSTDSQGIPYTRRVSRRASLRAWHSITLVASSTPRATGGPRAGHTGVASAHKSATPSRRFPLPLQRPTFTPTPSPRCFSRGRRGTRRSPQHTLLSLNGRRGLPRMERDGWNPALARRLRVNMRWCKKKRSSAPASHLG